jgi:hypothetical protein
MDNIFEYFSDAVDLEAVRDLARVYENPKGPWQHVIDEAKDVPTMYCGYFQTAKHFEDMISRKNILDWLGLSEGSLPANVLSLYPRVKEGAFIHVRRGDFLSPDHIVHHIDLTNYYERALKLFDAKRPLFIISDDIAFCQTMRVFESREDVIFVRDLNEIESLCLMTLCNLGGVAANSTFSWFGAYLNPNEGKIVTLPMPWWTLPEYETEDLYFDGAIISRSYPCNV